MLKFKNVKKNIYVPSEEAYVNTREKVSRQVLQKLQHQVHSVIYDIILTVREFTGG